MAKITYNNKSYLNQNPNIPATNKVNDTDMNEIKSVVNDNYDEFIAETFYESGDEVELGDTNSANLYICPGYITSSSTTLYIMVTTSKRLDNINSVTIDNLNVEGRSQNGYLNNQSGYNEYVGASGYTITAGIASPNAIAIKIAKSSAWTYGLGATTVPNNTLITLAGYIKISLS